MKRRHFQLYRPEMSTHGQMLSESQFCHTRRSTALITTPCTHIRLSPRMSNVGTRSSVPGQKYTAFIELRIIQKISRSPDNSTLLALTQNQYGPRCRLDSDSQSMLKNSSASCSLQNNSASGESKLCQDAAHRAQGRLHKAIVIHVP